LLDIVSAGFLTIDSIVLPGRQSPFVVLGGSATYVSLTSARLGAKVAAVSKIGGDFPAAYEWWMREEGVDLSSLVRVEDARTTRYELRYSDDLSDRILILKNRAPPITVEDVPHALKTRVVHVAPVAGEISFEVAESLRSCAEILSLDAQGFVRCFDQNGSVSVEPLADKRVLPLVDIYKSSFREAEAVTGQSEIASAIKTLHDLGVKIVIVTLGASGATVSVEGALHNVPAYKPGKLVDPTGAGDAFIGGFLAEYVRGEDCAWCACTGSAAASVAVEGIGPTSLGDKEEIYRRAHVLYEKGIK
jgi:sugar/nucleoside kinase (ribokinase family)